LFYTFDNFSVHLYAYSNGRILKAILS